MEQIILDYLRSLHWIAVLEKKVFTGLVNVMYVNFIGANGCFYSFLIAYNETQLFAKPSVVLGTNQESTADVLSSNLRVFKDKESWLEGKWDIRIAKSFNQYLEQSISNCINTSIHTEHYSILSGKVWTSPALGFSLIIAKDGYYNQTLSFWMGSVTIVENNAELLKLLEMLGLSKYVLLHTDSRDKLPILDTF